MYCLYASPLMLLLLAIVDCSVNRNQFEVDASLANKICPVDKLLFKKKAVSPIYCLAIASSTAGCAGLGYIEELQMCYGCSTSTEYAGEFQSLPGTVFYSRPKACPGVFRNISGYMMMVVKAQPRTYYKANSACAVCSASLVRIDSLEKQAAIRGHLHGLDTSGDKYWIQCRKDTSDGVWKFDDGAPVPMTNDYWYPDMPRDTGGFNCAYMLNILDYTWLNTECIYELGYICEIK